MTTKEHASFVPLNQRPVVELPPQSYQPSKAEIEADARIAGVTFKQAIEGLLRPVRIRRVTRKRSGENHATTS